MYQLFLFCLNLKSQPFSFIWIKISQPFLFYLNQKVSDICIFNLNQKVSAIFILSDSMIQIPLVLILWILPSDIYTDNPSSRGPRRPKNIFHYLSPEGGVQGGFEKCQTFFFEGFPYRAAFIKNKSEDSRGKRNSGRS